MDISTTAAPTDWGTVAPPPGLDESRFAGDERLSVSFFRKPVEITGESVKAGRAIYREVDYIRIMVPGDKLSVIERPVDDIDARRFASRYEKWKVTQQNVIEGTPLSALPGMNPAKVEEYKFFGVHTVEQLSEVGDNVGSKFASFQEDKRRARHLLEVAKGNAPIEKMNAELAQRDAQIEELRAQVQALSDSMRKKSKPAEAE